MIYKLFFKHCSYDIVADGANSPVPPDRLVEEMMFPAINEILTKEVQSALIR